MTSHIRTIAEAEAYLLQYSPLKLSGESYTLGRMCALMTKIGDPQNTLRVIHVAGTSGKTSTSYYIRNLLEATGCKTGLTASPHIESITERVQIDGKPLSDAKFIAYLNEFLDIISEWPELEPTYFELLIAFSYFVFTREKVEYAIVEVGLGGLLDATNVIDREDKVCVLTPIGLDHTQILGATTAEIAAFKAGIITSGNRVFSASQSEDVVSVFDTITKQQNAEISYVKLRETSEPHIPLFQWQNWCLAEQAYEYVCQRDGLSVASEEIKARLLMTNPPGRYERYRIGKKTIILDGAHNPQKLEALRKAVAQEDKGEVAMVMGLISAPELKIENCMAECLAISHTIIATEFTVGQDVKHRQSVSASSLAVVARDHDVTIETEHEPLKALDTLLGSKHTVIIITGSLYLVALLRPRIRELAAQ